MTFCCSLKRSFTISFLVSLLMLSTVLGFHYPAFGQASDISAPANNSKQQFGALTFNKTITDTGGKTYLIGEVSNSGSKNQTIDALLYFGKDSTPVSSNFVRFIGAINPGMGVPFKIPLQNTSSGKLYPDPEQLRVDSRLIPSTPLSNDSNLQVDYSTLVMNNDTHAITGMLDNKSPDDAYGITVSALAMDKQAKILDVVESKVIPSISANSSASFTLVPLKSIADQVSVYSCFVPGEAGLNVTLPIENNQTVRFEMESEGKIRHIAYNTTTHSIDFDAQATLLRGGWLGMMFVEGPNSFVDGNFTVMVNGHNATKSLISSEELSPGRYYRHIEAWYPFGKNTVSIVKTSVVPEFPLVPAVTVSALGILMFFNYFFRKKYFI